MALKLMGKKRGMMQLFDAQGHIVVCTVIEVEPNVVTQLKTVDTDGYAAVQLGFDKVGGKTSYTVEKRIGKPLVGHYAKAGVAPRRHLLESKVDSSQYTVGQELDISLFADIAFVDVQGVSKGKGYQGVMKRHGFAGGPASHGSGFHRHAGSTGMRSTPGRCLPGGKKAGQMGNERVTVQNLAVIKVDIDTRVILVKGQVPGPAGGLVYLTPSKKKIAKTNRAQAA